MNVLVAIPYLPSPLNDGGKRFITVKGDSVRRRRIRLRVSILWPLNLKTADVPEH